jgi:uncharacterized membrane protein
MRKSLEIAALLLLVFAWIATARAVLGAQALPPRIPTHFNAAGEPDGWGTPGMLWLMPIVAAVIYGLMSLVARYPRAFNFPMFPSPAVRPRLEAIALSMIAWLKAEVMGLFAWIQYETIHFARNGEGKLPALFLPAVLVVVFGTIAWHIAAMRRTVRA